MDDIKEILGPEQTQDVFFTSIEYAHKLRSLDGEMDLHDLPEDAILVTGIANPIPLVEYLDNLGIHLKHFQFPDHYNFDKKDIEKIGKAGFILTTEKDYMRLKDHFPKDQLGYLPIKTSFLGNEAEDFNSQVLNFINKK